MEVIGAIASFIAIGQAVGAAPKIIDTLRSFIRASKELERLVTELDELHMVYQHLKGNIDLFSGNHNSPLLQIDEPPYLKHVRMDLESLMRQLQDLATSCQREGRYGLRVSKIRWWKKQESIARLRNECERQKKQLQSIYELFRDQILHKQAEMLVHIHARIVPEEKTSFHQTASLPSPNGDSCLELRDTVEPGGIITLRDTASLKPITAAEEVIVHRCRCFCHANQRSKHTRGLYINPFRGTFFSARLRGVQGNQCELNCCAASQTSVSLRFCVPIWLRSSVITGTLTLGLPFNLHMSLTTTIVYRAPYGQLYRICSLGRPDLFHEWLSMYARGIQNVDEFGDYVLQVLVKLGGYSLLTHCITTWPTLIQNTEAGRVASSSAKLVLALGPSESDAIHLERFVRFVEEEEEENDDEDKILKVMQSKHRITQLNQTLRDTPNFLTRKTFNGETLLHWACVVDDLELVKHILSLGGPLNIADNAGNTPLHFALLHESWSSAVVLVEKDCQANVSNNRGDTPLLLLAESPTPGEVRVAQLVKTLLSRGDIPWARDKWKNNVWHQLGRFRTLQNDLWELYELLLHAGGVDLINAKNIHGETPLIIALVKQNLSLISFLRQTSARYDFIDDSGWNFLHYVSYFGDSLCCRLLDGFEISCLDIRTSNNDGWTPLEIFRCMVSKYFVLSEKELASAYAVKLWNARKENPLEDIVSGDKAEAFENLLRGIRDRVLIQEIKELELIISKIEAQDLASARDDLKRLVEGKVKAKIDDEAETFRAIELDIRGGRHELAIESIEVFIEVSRDRMKISPFDEEENPWKLSESDSEASDGTSWESERSVVEIETDAEDEVGWGSSEDDDDRSNDDVSREGEDEDEGWKTADED